MPPELFRTTISPLAEVFPLSCSWELVLLKGLQYEGFCHLDISYRNCEGTYVRQHPLIRAGCKQTLALRLKAYSGSDSLDLRAPLTTFSDATGSTT